MDVQSLPRRTAHAVHALLAASNTVQGGQHLPPAHDVCLWDGEALSVRGTAAALVHAQRLGLAVYVPDMQNRALGYWTPTQLALEHRRAFEDRYLAETDDGTSS